MRLAAFLVGVAVLLLVAGCDDEVGAPEEPVTLGYCPTMSGLAERVASENPVVSLRPFDFTAQALQGLNDGLVDAVLVGRPAREGELDDAFEKRLGTGLTLVGRQKRLISVAELGRSRIHTAADEGLARDYLPPTAEVVFHDSVESALREGLDEMVLVDWDEYSDGLRLVIPVDAAGRKVERFRLPVLYSYDEGVIQRLDVRTGER
ncbi:MAG: hypothetical protein ACLFO2_00755 [Candidatus Woesearchaeota archaeon]